MLSPCPRSGRHHEMFFFSLYFILFTLPSCDFFIWSLARQAPSRSRRRGCEINPPARGICEIQFLSSSPPSLVPSKSKLRFLRETSLRPCRPCGYAMEGLADDRGGSRAWYPVVRIVRRRKFRASWNRHRRSPADPDARDPLSRVVVFCFFGLDTQLLPLWVWRVGDFGISVGKYGWYYL